jgi:hypothetical protein
MCRTLSQVKVEVILRPTVSRLIFPGFKVTIKACDQFPPPLEIVFGQLRACYFMVPSLTRGRVCDLLSLLGLASAVPLGCESRETQDHNLLFQFFRLPPNQEGQVPVFISLRDWVAQLYPRALGSFSVASYDSQGYGGGIETCLPTGMCRTVLFTTMQGHFVASCSCTEAVKLCRFLLLLQSDMDLSDMQNCSMTGRCGGLRKCMYRIWGGGVAVSRSLEITALNLCQQR